MIDIDADLLYLGGLRPDVGSVHVDDIAVNEHLPGVGRKFFVCSSTIFCSISSRSSCVTGTRSTIFRFLFAMIHRPFHSRGLGTSPTSKTDAARQGRGGPFVRECGYTPYACYICHNGDKKRSACHYDKRLDLHQLFEQILYIPLIVFSFPHQPTDAVRLIPLLQELGERPIECDLPPLDHAAILLHGICCFAD